MGSVSSEQGHVWQILSDRSGRVRLIGTDANGVPREVLVDADGRLVFGSTINVGVVDQGAAGADPWLVAVSNPTDVSTLATQATLALLEGKTPDQAGTWDYRAGVSGTPSFPANAKVLQITAIALGAAGSLTINGGDTIPIPYDATDKVSSDLSIGPKGNLVSPVLVFTGTDGYFVEFTT